MILLIKITDPKTGLKRTLSFNEGSEKFILDSQDRIPQTIFNTHLPEELRYMLDCFRGGRFGGELLRDRVTDIILDELNSFVRNRIWEDREKLNSIISNFFSEIILIPNH